MSVIIPKTLYDNIDVTVSVDNSSCPGATVYDGHTALINVDTITTVQLPWGTSSNDNNAKFYRITGNDHYGDVVFDNDTNVDGITFNSSTGLLTSTLKDVNPSDEGRLL